MKAYDFTYRAIVEKKGGELIVKGYNSPYPSQKDAQSIDDIKYALKDKELDDGIYNIVLECKFLENEDGSFNQIFNLEVCEPKK